MNSLSYLSTTLLRRKGVVQESGIVDQNDQDGFMVTDIKHEITKAIPDGEMNDNTEESQNLKLKEASSTNGSNTENVNRNGKLIISTLIFIPKYVIYFPFYYILKVLLYPFIKLYLLMTRAFNWMFFAETDDTDFPNEESDSQNDLDLNDAIAESSSYSTTSLRHDKSVKYSPKSNISTIVEETMEFDPDDQNDDYFKSPLDTRPVISAVDLDDKPEKDIIRPTTTTNEGGDTPINSTTSFDKNVESSKIMTTPKSELKTPVKSSSSSSSQKASKKKKKFIFPKLLFDFDILNPPNLPKKTLVLDLDETLIHSLSRYNSSAMNKSKGRSIEVKVAGNVPTLYHIYKRPYVEEFLSTVYQWFDLVCFTASIKEYADPVITYLEEQVIANSSLKKAHEQQKFEIPKRIFKQRFYRNSCIFIEGKGYVKDLSVVINEQNFEISKNYKSAGLPKSRSRASSISSNVSRSSNSNNKMLDYSKILIIDNSPISYVRHKNNGLMVEGWINDPDDNELMALLPVLNSLRFVSDVRCVLGLKDGQNVFK
ncbi:hypothetical protein CANINC_001555 [Pichia inconspicua]|uniref:Mitochondrial import inner membrane translocase subunit TIM50 n=1 Tax=Pichia inconspicua TaxID=52247 RepID=A0A4T0X4L5_9ASCO|nr:hypothetical protein CANINC_001555 [[Candida] inconspicua]